MGGCVDEAFLMSFSGDDGLWIRYGVHGMA
jgi:hypothetical protein